MHENKVLHTLYHYFIIILISGHLDLGFSVNFICKSFKGVGRMKISIKRSFLLLFSLVGLSSAATPAPAPTIKITYADAQTFFENRPAKMIVAMTKDILNAANPGDHNDTAALYLIDFSKNPLQPELIIDSAVAMFGDPALSYDGTRVAFGRQGADKARSKGIYLCDAKAGAPNLTLIDPNGYTPTWWVHPQTGDEYIIYANTPGIGWGSITEANGITANTYIRKLVKGTTTFAEPAKILVAGYAFRHGRSPDGRYMVTNWPGWDFIEIDPNVTENATITWRYHGESRICMGNISRNLADPMNSLWFDLNHYYVAYDIWAPKKITYPTPFTSGQYNRWANNGDYFTTCLLNNAAYNCVGGVDCTGRKKVSFEGNTSTNAACIYKFSSRKWMVVTQGSRATALWVSKSAQRCQTPTLIINDVTVPSERYYNYVFKTKATVKLISPDGVKIRYTTNDTLPVSSWTEYTGPFEITSTCFLSFMAISNNLSQMDNSGILRKGIAKTSWTYEGLVFSTPPYSLSYNVNQYMHMFDNNNATAFLATYPIYYEAFAGFDAGASRTLTKITFRPRNGKLNNDEVSWEMSGGKFQGSNTSFDKGYEDFAVVGSVTQNADNVINVTSGKKYRYIRYLFPQSTTVNNVRVNNSMIAELDISFSDANPTALPTPSIQPLGGNFTNTIQVTMSHVSGADIFYTTNNSIPTAQSTKYSGAITLSATTTLKAIAIQNGKTSEVETATFTKISGAVTAPVIAAGTTFNDSVSVSITCATTGAKIQYTLDGSNPTASSPVYSKPIVLKTTTLVKAFATMTGLTSSQVVYENFVKNNDCGTKGGRVVWPNGGEVIKADSLSYFKWICCDKSKLYQAEIYLSLDGGRTIGEPLINNSIEFSSDMWGRFPWKGEGIPTGASKVYTNCKLYVYQYGAGLVDESDNSFTIVPTGVGTIQQLTKQNQKLLPINAKYSDGILQLKVSCVKQARVSIVDLHGKNLGTYSFTGLTNKSVKIKTPASGLCILNAVIDGVSYKISQVAR